jgi:membrane-bound serine protease (ClpP class)
VGGASRRGSRPGWIAALISLLLALTIGLAHAERGSRPIVYVATIEGEIDLGLAPHAARVLDEAERAGADAVVFRIDTFGGRVDAAVSIRDALLRSPLRSVAFVNQRAISAGALIALAAQHIAMAEGATLGAAAPVQAAPGGEAQPAGEKATSYVRKEFRATAEIRGRPTDLAEAMVDADVAVPGVVEQGKLLTLTTGEALALGVADFRADGLQDVLAELGLAGAEIREVQPNWAESLVRFLTAPAVSSLLLALGTLGVLLELRTPGFGVPGIVGLASLALFFWAHWLVRLVGWEEIALLAAGAVLLALEAFVVPGFGVAGILGILALVAGLTLSLVGAGVTLERLVLALGQVALAVLVALAGALGLLRVLPRLPIGRRLVLAGGLGAETAPPAAPTEPGGVRPGDQGIAASPLRPAGIASFAGARVDVVSEGEYIAAGEGVEVLRVEGSRVVVRRARLTA